MRWCVICVSRIVYGIISTDDILLTNIMPFTRHKKQLMNQWIWGESRQRQSPNEDEGSDKIRGSHWWRRCWIDEFDSCIRLYWLVCLIGDWCLNGEMGMIDSVDRRWRKARFRTRVSETSKLHVENFLGWLSRSAYCQYEHQWWYGYCSFYIWYLSQYVYVYVSQSKLSSNTLPDDRHVLISSMRMYLFMMRSIEICRGTSTIWDDVWYAYHE